MNRSGQIATLMSNQSLLKIKRDPSEKILRLLQVHYGDLSKESFLIPTPAGIILDLNKIQKDDVIFAIYAAVEEYKASLNDGGCGGGI